MRVISIVAVLMLTLVAFGTACGNDQDRAFTDISKRPDKWPKPTDPPPASPIYHDVKERVPTEEEIDRESRERPATLAAGIEGALLNGDALAKEMAFVYLLPELLQVEPARLLDLHSRLEPGAARSLLATEIARQWMSRDPPAATRWIGKLEGVERRAAVMATVRDLVPWSPGAARGLVEQVGLGQEAEIRRLLAPAGR